MATEERAIYSDFTQKQLIKKLSRNDDNHYLLLRSHTRRRNSFLKCIIYICLTAIECASSGLVSS